MGMIPITNINKGIDVLHDPAAIPDGFVADMYGFEVSPEGRLDTAGGLATGDLAAYLPPTGAIQWCDEYYIGTTRYVLATTSDGLYSNGTLVADYFIGRFKGVSYASTIYLVNGSFAVRFDGSSVWKWGLDFPTTNPTITESATGTSSLVGSYYFLYTYCRNDAFGNTITESSPTRVADVMQLIGPVTFAGKAIEFSSRPLSLDPQVNGANLYAISADTTSGDLTDYWLIYSWLDNTTTSGTLPAGTGVTTASRIMYSQWNYPAPAGQDVATYWDKIFMVGLPGQLDILATSDILGDGTLAPEGWPPRNQYKLDGNDGALLNIDLLNQKLSVKGQFGEWQVDTTDPTDYLQTRARRVSENGLASQDGIIRLPNQHIYPSKRGFVETNINTSQFIFPELTPLIDGYIGEAMGVNAGLVSYFTYRTAALGYRTAKIDVYNGGPRFTNLNDIHFSQMFYDAKNGIPYGIIDGSVGIMDRGTVNEYVPNRELDLYLKSKTYQLDSPRVWQVVSFQHNTNGQWFDLKCYVDDVLIATFPFRSTYKTLEYFRFLGPGTQFYFEILGSYKLLASIYLPIRIQYSGGK